MFILLDRCDGVVSWVEVDAHGTPVSASGDVGHTRADALSGETGRVCEARVDGWVASVAELEAAHHPRWVWSDTTNWYPHLLAGGIRVERSVDLRLSRAILRASTLTASSSLARSVTDEWDASSASSATVDSHHTLFDFDSGNDNDIDTNTDRLYAEVRRPSGALLEFASQRAAIHGAVDPARIGILLAAESAGALIAAEMRFAGLPWDPAIHDALLTTQLGARPVHGTRPAELELALTEVRGELGAPNLNPDSPPDLLRALARAGIAVTSTRSGELRKVQHPAIGPLLRYKKLARLLTANGWNWLDINVRERRFHPEFVPGGVITGRWASTGGGGALQLPQQIRSAVVADPGWKLVVADAAQLEPRILAAMSGDRGMIEAGAAGDLYAGIVASGAIDTREHAKVAMLGAMYGATTGESGRLMPRLPRVYPNAIGLVEEAARAGERGESVTTRLGRSSPRGIEPGYDETADGEQRAITRTRARSWGRFTRNFVVQGTAAEWALCWMATLRPKLRMLGADAGLTAEPHLVFFLHDEVVVHTPAALAARVEIAIEQAAADAGRLLFGEVPIVFPLTIATVDDYGQAKK